MKTEYEPLPSDINCIWERSRVSACFKNSVLFHSDCMTLPKYKYREISGATNSGLLGFCIAVVFLRLRHSVEENALTCHHMEAFVSWCKKIGCPAHLKLKYCERNHL